MAIETETETGMEALSESELEGLGLPTTETEAETAIEAEVEAEVEAEASAEAEASPEFLGGLIGGIVSGIGGLFQSGAEAAEGGMARGATRPLPFAAPRAPMARGGLAQFVLRKTAATVLRYIRAVVKQMQLKPALKTKLAAAVRAGAPRTGRLLLPAVHRALPKHFRWAAAPLVPTMVRANFQWIASRAGLAASESEAIEMDTEAAY